MDIAKDHTRFAEGLSKLFLACGRPVPTLFDQRAYHEVLEDIPIEAVVAGLAQAARDADGFLPTAGQVRKLAIEIKPEPRWRALPQREASTLSEDQAATNQERLRVFLKRPPALGAKGPTISLQEAREGAATTRQLAAEAGKGLAYWREVYSRAAPGQSAALARQQKARFASDENHWLGLAEWHDDQARMHERARP